MAITRLSFAWILVVVALCVAFLGAAAADPPAAPAPAPSAIEVRVDERVELLCIMARLAGNPEYSTRQSTSPYSARVHEHFGAFREHRAVQLLRELRRTNGVSFDAIVLLAVHLGPLPELNEKVPFTPRPPRLDARWAPERTKAFLAALRDFTREAKADEFFAAETEFYRESAARLRQVVESARAVPWFDKFFGVKAGASYAVIPGLLCGSTNYGAGVRYDDERPEEIRPILGCANWDADGLPVFTKLTVPLLVHELCHSYTNPIVDRHAEALDPPAQALFEVVDKAMRRQAYGTARIMVYESMVRACVVRYLRDVQGELAAMTQARDDASRGFTWIDDLATALDEYAKDRVRYPTLDAFMPKIVEFFETRGAAIVKERKEAAKAPKRGSV